MFFDSVWRGPAAKSWDDEQQHIVEWLQRVQTPFAVMACSDIRGQHVINACFSLNLTVPEQVAVIGVDNDELVCLFCTPSLSSVIPNAELIGYRAAELLQQLIDGNEIEERVHLIVECKLSGRI